MLLDDNEQQQSFDSFCSAPTNWTSESLTKDHFHDQMKNSLRVNSPELALKGVDFDDVNSEYKSSSRQPLVEQLKAQLIHNQIQRTQARDYLRILRQSNTPAQWYKSPSLSRSVYYYDTNYQRRIQQRSTFYEKPKINVQVIPPKPVQIPRRLIKQPSFVQHNAVSFSPRTKYMLDLYNTAINCHQLKQRSFENFHPPSPNISQRHPSGRSRLPSVPALPPINMSKQQDLLNTKDRQTPNHQPIVVELRKKFNPILMPPTS